MERAVNPALRGLGTFNKELWEAFKDGETGYPMVDAAVLYNNIIYNYLFFINHLSYLF